MQITDWGDAIFLSLSNALSTLLAAIPLVIGALLIVAIGWIISSVVARIVKEVLERVGADRLFAEHGGEVYGTRSSSFQPSKVAAEIVKWIIRFFFLIAAANVLGMPQVSLLLNEVLLWIPNLIVAAIILLVAPLLARFVRGAIKVGAGRMGFSNAALLGRIAEVAIVAFAVLVAVKQLGIAADFINILVVGFVAAVSLAFGLAFGLGGREVAAQVTQDWYASVNRAGEKVRAATADLDGSTVKDGPTVRQDSTVMVDPTVATDRRST